MTVIAIDVGGTTMKGTVIEGRARSVEHQPGAPVPHRTGAPESPAGRLCPRLSRPGYSSPLMLGVREW
jgi:hypothetical protein